MTEPIEKTSPWLLPPRKGKPLQPGLHIVATPIGNLGDITLRALDTLAAADLVVCEDTRVTGKLLKHYGIRRPLLPYNDHNAAQQKPVILGKLKAGGRVVFVSDAGTPLVSDPGYKLVQDCIEEGIYVTALPGPSAVLTALQLAGLPTDSFCFAGFLPPKPNARKKALAGWRDVAPTLVLFETAPRLVAALRDMLDVLGDRPAAVMREMTKLFEEARRGSLSELLQYYENKGPPKGEVVLVVGGAAADEKEDVDVEALLKAALRKHGTREAAALVAQQTGLPRRELYALALKLGKK